MNTARLALPSGVGLAQSPHCTSLASVLTWCFHLKAGHLGSKGSNANNFDSFCFPQKQPTPAIHKLKQAVVCGTLGSTTRITLWPNTSSNRCVSKDSYCKIKLLQPQFFLMYKQPSSASRCAIVKNISHALPYTLPSQRQAFRYFYNRTSHPLAINDIIKLHFKHAQDHMTEKAFIHCNFH